MASVGLLYPTHRQAVLALLNAILTHTEVLNSEIYYPAVIGEVPQLQPIRIVSGRTFGGTELIEDGLTIAVYPEHSSLDQMRPSFSRNGPKSVVYKDQYLGRVDNANYGVGSTINLVVQLFYRDASLNVPVELVSDLVVSEEDSPYPLTIPHGRLVQYKDSSITPGLTPSLEERLPEGIAGTSIQQAILGASNVIPNILVLPGEDILRDWMSLLTTVIRSLVVLYPFALRNPTILYVDYPTTNWLRQGVNLVFHTSYLIVSYEAVEPSPKYKYSFPAPTQINLETST